MEKTRLDTGVSENFQVSQENDEMIIFHRELAETRVTKKKKCFMAGCLPRTAQSTGPSQERGRDQGDPQKR